MVTDTDRVIESLRELADRLDNGDAKLREYELKFVRSDGELSGKNVDLWVEYD